MAVLRSIAIFSCLASLGMHQQVVTKDSFPRSISLLEDSSSASADVFANVAPSICFQEQNTMKDYDVQNLCGSSPMLICRCYTAIHSNEFYRFVNARRPKKYTEMSTLFVASLTLHFQLTDATKTLMVLSFHSTGSFMPLFL